jgi:uncharacterized protein (TIGR00369 family)
VSAATPGIAELQTLLDDSPFHGFLRMEIVALDPEEKRLVLRLPFRPEYQRMKATGQLHGGPVAALIDVAGTFVMWGAVGIPAPTVSLRVDYLRPAVRTALVATAAVRRAGRTVAVVDVEVHDEQGLLVALGRGTYGAQIREERA